MSCLLAGIVNDTSNGCRDHQKGEEIEYHCTLEKPSFLS